MPESTSRNSARLLAPIALAVFAVVFFIVVIGSSGGGDEAAQRTTTTKRSGGERRAGTRTTRRKPQGSTYTVKTGDTLGSIAEKTGVPVEQLQERNPDLDAQALVSGQKINLRE